MVGKRKLLIKVNDKYGNLSVIKESRSRVKVYSGKRRILRFLSVKCICGNILDVGLAELRNGQESCGCVGVSEGDHKTRLYHCWTSMKVRARFRNNCFIYPCWNKYIHFKKWAISNGYADTLVLCRNKDTGNYQPDNVRWDTKTSNTQEAQSKVFLVIDFSGNKTLVTNMRKYCRDNNLSRECIVRVLSGKRNKHKGCRYFKIIDTKTVDI